MYHCHSQARCYFVVILLGVTTQSICLAQPGPPAPGPICPIAYLGEANGICYYETQTPDPVTQSCGAPFSFGVAPPPEITNFACNNGVCESPVTPAVVMNDLAEKSGKPAANTSNVGRLLSAFAPSDTAVPAAPMPNNDGQLANATAILTKLLPVLKKMKTSSEVEQARKKRIEANYPELEKLLADLNDQSIAVADRVAKYNSFLSEKDAYVRMDYLIYTQISGTRPKKALDFDLQETVGSAAAVRVAIGPGVIISWGPKVKAVPAGLDPVYFQLFTLTRDGQSISCGQQVSPPVDSDGKLDESGFESGSFFDRHSYSHVLNVRNSLWLVSTKSDLGFGLTKFGDM